MALLPGNEQAVATSLFLSLDRVDVPGNLLTNPSMEEKVLRKAIHAYLKDHI